MEADSLRWWLLIIGSLVIVGLAVHGIWLSRKNSEKKANTKQHKKDQEFQPSGWQSDNEDFDEISEDENDEINQDPHIKFDIETDHDALNLTDPSFIKNDFDDLGLGAVRVVSNDNQAEAEAEIEKEPTSGSATKAIPETDISTGTEQPIPTTDSQSEPNASTSKIYASVVTQPKPEYASKYTSLAAETVAITQQERAATSNNTTSQKTGSSQISGSLNNSFKSNDNYQAPEPPPFLLKKEAQQAENMSEQNDATKQPNHEHSSAAIDNNEAVDNSTAKTPEKLSLTEQARNLVKGKKSEPVKKRREPKIADDQMRIDFDEQPKGAPEVKEQPVTEPVEAQQPQEVLVLNVKSADDNPIPGAALLPMLLTLGFKFGEQDIFHRHVNSNGKGPVLFSLANMFKPGNFDIDNLENFTTQGISLFMILPIEGEPHQVFNMMHNAARKIADEFSAQIYDGKRTLLTKQSLQQYVEKIREFERKRLLRG